MSRWLRPYRFHGDTDMRQCQGGAIIHAVANECDDLSFFLNQLLEYKPIYLPAAYYPWASVKPSSRLTAFPPFLVVAPTASQGS
jgi:hypothetical protein